MDAMNLNQWILAASIVMVAVFVSITLVRLIRLDGYGPRTSPDPSADWGTPTRPSVPYTHVRL